MFAFIIAVLVLLLVIVTVLRSPLILLLAALVFAYLYVVVPSQDPTAARFGELDPTQVSPAPATPPVKVRRALPVAVRRTPNCSPSNFDGE